MSTEIRVPKLGMGMTEGVLSEWLVQDGAYVEAGSDLYSLENEKSIQEIEAPVSGKLRVVGKEGETYAVGEVIGYID